MMKWLQTTALDRKLVKLVAPLTILIVVLVGLYLHGEAQRIFAAPLIESDVATAGTVDRLSGVTSIVASTCSNNDPLNPYNNGFSDQCTWYVWEHRHQVGHDLPSVAWGNAKDWPAKAIAAGYPTGVIPRVGAVLVCQPNACNGAFSLGHVAYVEKVLSATSIQISEQNWDAPCVKDFRTLSVGVGMLFIYNLGDPLSPTVTPTPVTTPPSNNLGHVVYLPSVLTAQ